MTKEDIPLISGKSYQFQEEDIVCPIDSVYKAMDKYARQQAIAFVIYSCPDVKFNIHLLGAGYDFFLFKQSK